MIRVRLPSQLHSYTKGLAILEVDAPTLSSLADCLEENFPGVRFRIIDEHNRIRRHIQFFVNGEMIRTLDHPLADGDEVHIVGALSGG